jgi:hypothetical protein
MMAVVQNLVPMALITRTVVAATTAEAVAEVVVATGEETAAAPVEAMDNNNCGGSTPQLLFLNSSW